MSPVPFSPDHPAEVTDDVVEDPGITRPDDVVARLVLDDRVLPHSRASGHGG
jgi:hypothetical protein